MVFSMLAITVTACSKPEQGGFEIKRIAHAGGSYNGLTYTNSLEALDQNFARGFVYFEIDFVETTDGHLVCLHDWDEAFFQAFNKPGDNAISLAEFNTLLNDEPAYTPCTIASLAQWMEDHPYTKIISDIKGDNLKGLALLQQTLPFANDRLIPQVYDPNHFRQIKALGFNQVVWTLYRFAGSDDEVLKWAETLPVPFAITMPRYRVQTGLAQSLRAKAVPTYTHTINSAIDLVYLTWFKGVSEIYTDTLAPGSP